MTVIEALEYALAKAKSGELTGVAIATTHADLSTASIWAMEDATLAEILGSVAIMQMRLCHNSLPENAA